MGNKIDELKQWIAQVGNNKIAFIPNAMDVYPDSSRKNESLANSIKDLESIGFSVETLDLKQYFGKETQLQKRIEGISTFFARGGNTFVLRRAMKLSSFDEFLIKHKSAKDILYGGFSAGICCLGQTMRGLELVDDATIDPYDTGSIVWEGVGLIDFLPVPHYRSDHPESKAIDKVVDYLENHSIPYKTFRDGEATIMDIQV